VVLQEVRGLSSTIILNTLPQLPQHLLSQGRVLQAVETYRSFLTDAGRYPHSLFPPLCYMSLQQDFASLLVHVLAHSPLYTPPDGDETQQTPQTAEEEAILLLLLLLKEQIDEKGSVSKVKSVA
jgi:hypothetical protein